MKYVCYVYSAISIYNLIEQINSKWTLSEAYSTLFSGLSSVVRRCINKETGKEFAVKIIDRYSEKGKVMKGRDEEQQVRTEIETLSKVAGHPNISMYNVIWILSGETFIWHLETKLRHVSLNTY